MTCPASSPACSAPTPLSTSRPPGCGVVTRPSGADLDRAALAGRLNASIDAQGFSGVVSVRERGRVLFERAAGLADRSRGIENTPDTRFGIASGTKFLTALAIGKLIAAGRLAFETRLADCVPLELPHVAPEITIRHLLTHTSGIPDYFDEEQVANVEQFDPGVPASELRGPRDYLALFPDAPMKFPPGLAFSYSNGGYILLGVVIEELAGTRYQAFVEREIFASTGMSRSGFFALDRLPEGTALGYIEVDGGWRTNLGVLPIVGASDGGAFSTVQDLSTLWRAFLAGEVLPRELTDLYARPFVPVEKADGRTHAGYGLWFSEPAGGRREAILIGSDAGVSFRSSMIPAEGLELTVISNTTRGAWPIARDARRELEA